LANGVRFKSHIEKGWIGAELVFRIFGYNTPRSELYHPLLRLHEFLASDTIIPIDVSDKLDAVWMRRQDVGCFQDLLKRIRGSVETLPMRTLLRP
jgi:hypothetical protein